jgi:hypothetical protein
VHFRAEAAKRFIVVVVGQAAAERAGRMAIQKSKVSTIISSRRDRYI